MLIIADDQSARVMTIDETELLEIARSRITRGFTPGECDAYHLDPCPTLEEMRRG